MELQNNTKTSSRPKQSFMKPIVSYLGFLSKSILKKVSIMVTLGVGLALTLFFGLLPIFIDKPGSPNYEDMTSMMSGVFFTLVATFPALLGILTFLIAFKDGESNGTELLIMSKPIKRSQVLLSRLIFFSIVSIVIGLLFLTIGGINYEIINAQSETLNLNGVKIKFEAFLWNKSLYLGGIFGTAILSYLTFGFISACISNIASGKATRVVSLIVLFLSMGISIISSQLSMLFESGISSSISKTYEENESKVNSLVGKTMGEVFNLSSNQQRIKDCKITSIRSENGRSYPSQRFTPIFIDGEQYFEYRSYLPGSSSTDSSVGYLNYNDPNQGYSQSGNIYLSSSGSYNENYCYILKDKYKNYFNNKNILKVGQKYGASGFTALNYLNPISAFASIPSSHIEYKNTFTRWYNWGYDDNSVMIRKREMNLPYYLNSEIIGAYTKPDVSSDSWSEYFLIKTTPADPGWALGLTWMGLLALFGGLTSFGYSRKDFK